MKLVFFRFSGCVLSLLLCSGCSVRPLYDSPNYSDTEGFSDSISELFSSHDPKKESRGKIFVEVIAGRQGQRLRGYLQDFLRDQTTLKTRDFGSCMLKVGLREIDLPYALADDGNAQRLKVKLVAHVVLQSLSGTELLNTDVDISSSKNVASTQGDVLLSMYSTTSDTMLRELAMRIIERVALAIRMHPKENNQDNSKATVKAEALSETDGATQ